MTNKKKQSSNDLEKQNRYTGQSEKSEIELKQAIEKLKKYEDKYIDLFENANDAICILDSDLKFKEVNKKTLDMFGYTKEELLGMSAFDIIPPKDIPGFENEYNKLLKYGYYDNFIGKARKKDGTLIDIEVSSSVIREGDKISGTRDIIRDITDRVQIQEALLESEERYRTIIEFSNDLIWILDTQGRYQFINKRCEEFSGLKMEYFLGKPFTPFIDKQDLPHVIDTFHKTLKGEPQQYEVSVKKENGSNYFLSVNTAPIFSKGKVVGTVSFGRDITEHKKAEEHIRNSLKQRLMKSDRQKKLLCHLIEGTRGGKSRALILKHLTEKSYNAHQLAKILDMDYKTIRHHLNVLVKKGMISKGQKEYSGLYFIAGNIKSDLDDMNI